MVESAQVAYINAQLSLKALLLQQLSTESF